MYALGVWVKEYKGTDANSAIKKRSSAPNVFEQFKKTAEGGEKESFEVWDDYLAWRFAEEARKFWSQEVQGLDALGTGI